MIEDDDEEVEVDGACFSGKCEKMKRRRKENVVENREKRRGEELKKERVMNEYGIEIVRVST